MAKGKKSQMPASVSPMLCTLTKEPVSDPEYLFEIKWDGYRIISYVNKGKVRMDSRSALDYTKKYPPVVQAMKALKKDIVLDGEVVVFNKEGLPDFDALQLYNGHNSPISYCVFDVLWMDGYNLMHLPLTERKEIVKKVISGSVVLKFSESFEDGVTLYQQMLEMNLEGIVAKKKHSEYLPGVRSYEWLKIPTRKRQEFVIGGWAESQNGRAFRSLLFGAYEGKKLKWIGRSGGGYKQHEMPGILKQLKALETDESPFENPVLDTKGAVTHWVKPELVANFEFATWTKSGRIRKPATFLGFRKDKKAKQVVREIPAAIKTSKKKLQRAATGRK
jgi:bifunctional non-homologous end joining protein LigD